jgi:hypothetical protein
MYGMPHVYEPDGWNGWIKYSGPLCLENSNMMLAFFPFKNMSCQTLQYLIFSVSIW